MHMGRGPKYLLSGVLVCADCGHPLNISDKYSYCCATRRDGGPDACTNDVVVKRVAAEFKLLARIKNEFLSAANIEKLKRKAHRLLAERQANSGTERRELELKVAKLDVEIERYVSAIGNGLMSPTLRAKLEVAESQKVQIELKLGQTPVADRRVIEMIPKFIDRVTEIVGNLEAPVYAAGGAECARARADIKHLLHTVPVEGVVEGHKWVPYAVIAGAPRLLLRIVNGANSLSGNDDRGEPVCAEPGTIKMALALV